MSREILPLAELARAGACSAQLTSCAAEWPGGIPLTAESAWFKRARPWGAPLNAATHQRVRRSTAGKALPERRMQTEGDTMSNALKEARPERFDISVDSRGYVLVNGQFRIMANGNAVQGPQAARDAGSSVVLRASGRTAASDPLLGATPRQEIPPCESTPKNWRNCATS